jgi:cytochrome c553
MKKIVLFSLVVSGLFAANCAMCHNGSYQVKLDRFSPEQITQMMMDFKSGKKAGMTMPGIAKSMSDEEIKKVAKEYGTK